MAIIIVLLLINGVAGYLLFNENKEKQTKIDEIAKLDTDFKSMNAEFETAKTDLESLKGKNAELDAIIMERQATIEKVSSRACGYSTT
jgi:predicted RNase H-like nuclease (RuvC/YqgF family)